MSNLGELAGRQLGPLPLGAWALAVGGGVAVAIVVRRNALSAPASPAELYDPTADAGTGTGTAVNNAAGNSGGVTNIGTSYATNDEWEAAAVRWLIGARYDPTAAQAAVSRWLTGVPTTLAERAMVSAALVAIGGPPTSPPPPDSGLPTESAPPRVPVPPKYPTPGNPSSPKPTTQAPEGTVWTWSTAGAKWYAKHVPKPTKAPRAGTVWTWSYAGAKWYEKAK